MSDFICPNCNSELAYIGQAITNPPNNKVYHTFICKSCTKTFIHRNPEISVNSPEMQKAIALYESFNMKPHDKIDKIKISLPNPSNPLVQLAPIAGVLYDSDKQGIPDQRYIHYTENPKPTMYVTADGKTFLITGGRMCVKDGWLYY